ncbi:MAG TPA: DUF3999 family protein [Terriglobia bacterium]|nr:DUF3999 family protein [Terriglobia bacterium]
MKTAAVKRVWIVLLLVVSLQAQESPLQWEFSQELQVSRPGLVELKLPETLIDRTQPSLQDLRLEGADSREVPFYLKLPQSVQSAPSAAIAAKRFAVSMEERQTLVLVETGTSKALESLTIDTPTQNFLKSATVEGSADGKAWQVLIRNQPFFSQDGASGKELRFRKGIWPHLRVRLDDHRSAPVVIDGIQVRLAASEPESLERVRLILRERIEARQESRLRLQLPARNLFLWDLEIETAERVFTRTAAVHARSLSPAEIREETIATGGLYRIALDGHTPASDLNLRVGAQIREAELLLVVQNRDNLPLDIRQVTARWVPPVLGFVAAHPGAYTLRFGNPVAPAPTYDLNTLAGQLQEAHSKAVLGPLEHNPSYKRPESLPQLEPLAAVIDTAPWQYRASVRVENPGIQQLQLALPTLAHTDSSGRDLRLVRSGKQIPFLIERTTATQKLLPSVEAIVTEKGQRISRWRLKLPHRGLPLAYLSCVAPEKLFERSSVLFEEVEDERGSKQKRELGRTTWRHAGRDKAKELTLSISERSRSDALILEVENGDNQPLELKEFQCLLRGTGLEITSSLAAGSAAVNTRPGPPLSQPFCAEAQTLRRKQAV